MLLYTHILCSNKLEKHSNKVERFFLLLVFLTVPNTLIFSLGYQCAVNLWLLPFLFFSFQENCNQATLSMRDRDSTIRALDDDFWWHSSWWSRWERSELKAIVLSATSPPSTLKQLKGPVWCVHLLSVPRRNLCCGIFDQTMILQDCVTKINLGFRG